MSYSINQHFYPSKQVHLNSKYADAYGGFPTYKSWAFFSFKEPIIKLPQAYDFLLSLNCAEIPCSMYVVDARNNTFTYQVSSNTGVWFPTTTRTIPPGNYSAYDLASFLTFESPYNNILIKTSFSEITNKFQFIAYKSGITGFKIRLPSGKSSSIFGTTGLELNWDGSTVDISGNAITASDAVVDLAGTRSVFIKCMNIHTQAFDSRMKVSSNTLARVAIDQAPNGIIFWVDQTGFKSKCSVKELSTLEIQIIDSDGELVNFNNCDWTLTLQLDIIAQSPTEYQKDIPFQQTNIE